jgi:hypothetical protein
MSRRTSQAQELSLAFRVTELLQGLPKDSLAHVCGLSAPQISALLGVKGRNVRVTLHHLLKHKVVDRTISGPRKVYWRATGLDTRQYTLDWRKPEEGPRSTRSKREMQYAVERAEWLTFNRRW